jgi:hypothetical protein
VQVVQLPVVSKRVQIVQAAALAVIVLVGSVDAAASSGGGKSPSATKPSATPSAVPSPTKPPGAIVLFTDDFHDPGTGWATTKDKDGSSFGYFHGKYVAVLKSHFADEYLYAPGVPTKSLQGDLTAAQTAGFSAGSGFGMVCTQRDERTAASYDFMLIRINAATVHWFIRFRDGLPEKPGKEVILTKGDLHMAIGPRMIKLRSVCVTRQDNRTTDLTFVVNGHVVGQSHSTYRKALQVGAWRSGIVVSNAAGSTTVTATHFEMTSVAALTPLR